MALFVHQVERQQDVCSKIRFLGGTGSFGAAEVRANGYPLLAAMMGSNDKPVATFLCIARYLWSQFSDNDGSKRRSC
jgi:hypothetical protein